MCMAKYKRQSAPSDGYLQNWWRKAVKRVHGDRCKLCGAQPVECHHIVKRRYGVLRHDWRNGLPLCAECHAQADTIAGRERIAEHVDMDYLSAMERYDLKTFLAERGMTRGEFLRNELDELKRIVRFGR